MTAATAPSPEEIRLAILRSWHRPDVPSAVATTLSGQLEDAVAVYLLCDVQADLYEVPPEHLVHPIESIADEVLTPVIADVEQRILSAMASVIERYAEEHPDAPRARKVATG